LLRKEKLLKIAKKKLIIKKTLTKQNQLKKNRKIPIQINFNKRKQNPKMIIHQHHKNLKNNNKHKKIPNPNHRKNLKNNLNKLIM